MREEIGRAPRPGKGGSAVYTVSCGQAAQTEQRHVATADPARLARIPIAIEAERAMEELFMSL
jgi:hypothetical protein